MFNALFYLVALLCLLGYGGFSVLHLLAITCNLLITIQEIPELVILWVPTHNLSITIAHGSTSPIHLVMPMRPKQTIGQVVSNVCNYSSIKHYWVSSNCKELYSKQYSRSLLCNTVGMHPWIRSWWISIIDADVCRRLICKSHKDRIWWQIK